MRRRIHTGILRLSKSHRDKVENFIPYFAEFRKQDQAEKLEHLKLYTPTGCGFEACKWCEQAFRASSTLTKSDSKPERSNGRLFWG